MTTETLQALQTACASIGLDASRAELIRAGENHLYRLPGKIVARVTRPGQIEAARKEVKVSRWLALAGVPVVEALAHISQPAEVDGQAVTFWRELPPHRPGTLTELADLLRKLHALPAPDFALPPLAPFVRLRERLAEAPHSPLATGLGCSTGSSAWRIATPIYRPDVHGARCMVTHGAAMLQ